MSMHLFIYSAGIALGDFGPMGMGGGVYDPANQELAILCEHKGEGTRLQAEYLALMRLLEIAIRLGATRVTCYLSCAATARQIEGHAALPASSLLYLFLGIHEQLSGFREGYTLVSLPRRQNPWPEKLACFALDARHIRRGHPSVLDWAKLRSGPSLI